MSTGTIVTFYSYKGGTGRSMALANVAWILAANGKRVLVVDWDFEAPGLHRYFLPFLRDFELKETPGLIDLLWDYMEIAASEPSLRPIGLDDPLVLADPMRNAIPLEFPFSAANNGCLHLLGAGRQSHDYAARIRDFNWRTFYENFGGGAFFDAFRTRLKEQYDYVLVDSRTGVVDTAGICTIQIPDAVVLCFTYNRQSIKGVEAVAESIRRQATTGMPAILPIPMRVVKGESAHLNARQYARDCLEKFLPEAWDQDRLSAFWGNNEVQHYPAYSFQEVLAVFKENAQERNTLLADYLWLTGELTDHKINRMVSLEDKLRQRYVRRFELKDPRLAELKELVEDGSEASLSSMLAISKSAYREISIDGPWVKEIINALLEIGKKFVAAGNADIVQKSSQEIVKLSERLKAENNPDDFSFLHSAFNQTAYFNTSLGKHETAIGILKKALELFAKGNIDEQGNTNDLNRNTLVGLGNALLVLAETKQGMEFEQLTNEAIKQYCNTIRINPDDYIAYYNWGVALDSLSEKKTGDERYRLLTDSCGKYAETVRLQPDYVAAHNNWGRALNELAEKKEGDERELLLTDACAKCAEAIRLQPDCHIAYNNWGNALYHLAREKEGDERERLLTDACGKYAEAIRLQPDYHPAYSNWGNALDTLAQEKAGDERDRLLSDACAKYAEAVRLQPDFPPAYNNWGDTLDSLARGKEGDERERLLTDACAKYAEAVRLQPDYSRAYSNWGNALMYWATTKPRLQQIALFDEARLRLEQAEQISVGTGAYNLACLSALRGEKSEAVRWLLFSKEQGKLPSLSHIKNDPDLESIRSMEEYRRIIEED